MPRSIVLGNGRLQVNFDTAYVLRDLYYPHVGQENHFAGGHCRTGFWSQGRFAWEQDPQWERHIRYVEDTLVTQVLLYHPQWQIVFLFNDAVDMDRNIFLRRVTVTNQSDSPQEARIFFHYDFHIYGVEVGDTIFYEPSRRVLVAYKGRRYFLGNIQSHAGIGVSTWAIGITKALGREGTWRDAEDGRLEENPISQGAVDCTFALDLGRIPPETSVTGYHWLAAGLNRKEVEELDQLIKDRGPDNFIDRTQGWWLAWNSSNNINMSDLEDSSRKLYRRSLLTIRTHADDGGAIVASTDWDIISFSRDTYAYCWPRDGALVVMALDKAGYAELSRRFFTFCLQVLNPLDGYYLHKYTPGGELASSWHPWIGPDRQPQIPIQEDETGLVIYALWKHFQVYRDVEFIKPLYRPLVRATADFMVVYRAKATKLPLPSYDLWEERRGVHAYTIAAVWAGLQAAARFAETFRQTTIGNTYRNAAEEMRQAAIQALWDQEQGRFSRTLYPSGTHSYRRDPFLDVSLLALSLYGMVDPRDARMHATADAIYRHLWCQTPIGGLARYEGDSYQRTGVMPGIPGNPWFISTLWMAQYLISVADTRAELAKARELLAWVERYALPSGLLAEQVHPYSGDVLSVAPLSWSHAEYVSTIHDYVDAYRRLR